MSSTTKAGFVLTAVVCLALAAGTARASLVYNPANGHSYELINSTSEMTWDQAKTAAEGLSYQGYGGYLATLVTEAENTFVRANVLPPATEQFFYWIGGSRASQSDPWQWVTGETWNFTYWMPGKPDPTVKVEFISVPDQNLYGWNNRDAAGTRTNYMVEYDVPEPATMAILALGGVGMLLKRKRA